MIGLAPAPPPAAAPVPLRSEFAETAFWQPHLLTGPDGSAAIEFTVPDSVTSWNVFVHAVTRDWKAGSVEKQTKSVKELMVRPYVPRFLREGDRADLKIVVNNASDKPMAGRVAIDILDPDTNASVLSAFGLPAEKASLPFSVAAGRTNDPEPQGARACRPLRVQGHGGLGRHVRRRAAARAGPARPHSPDAVAVRGAPRPGPAGADVRGPGEERRRDACQRADGRHGGRAALRLDPAGAPVSRQLPLRVHRADVEPVRLDGHRVLALPRLSCDRENGRGNVAPRHAPRDLGCGRPQPEDGARGNAVAREGERRPRHGAAPLPRARSSGGEGGAGGGSAAR
jgi:hypothetical protein